MQTHPRLDTYEPQVDFFCDDPVQVANLNLRIGTVGIMPDFRFLNHPYRQKQDFGIIEKIVQGRVMDQDVQSKIPGAQLITLNEEDKKGVLARAYVRVEADLEKAITHPVESYVEMSKGFFSYKYRESWEVPDLEKELEEIRGKRHGLGVEPMSPDRLREIVSSLVDRVEGLLVPVPAFQSA